jgi:hypothetical protein
MSPHGFDHRFALGLGRVKAKFPIQREDLEIIRMGASRLWLTTWKGLRQLVNRDTIGPKPHLAIIKGRWRCITAACPVCWPSR